MLVGQAPSFLRLYSDMDNLIMFIEQELNKKCIQVQKKRLNSAKNLPDLYLIWAKRPIVGQAHPILCLFYFNA